MSTSSTIRYAPGRHQRPGPVLCFLLSGLLAACAGQEPRTLGSLRYEPEPVSEDNTASVAAETTHQEVLKEYEALLEVVDDAHIQEQIQRRVGEVYMLEGDQQQQRAATGKSYYLKAIKSYRQVLEKYPNSPDNAEILYQLAKAYDMEGDQEEALAILRELTKRHPNYTNIAEANFRKGDILFNLGAYAEAEQAYRAVTERRAVKFNLNAHYMLGWSRYKQLQFRPALDEFVFVMTELMGDGAALEELSPPNQSLAKDALHALSLSLDKLAGAAAIQEVPALRKQPYVRMIYDNLGEYYLEKELYEAAAESYRQFVSHYPDSELAPEMHRKMINIYMEGSFPRQAGLEKESFVEAYGVDSPWSRKRGGISEAIKTSLESYLDELARNYHARGQELQRQIAALKSNKDAIPRPEKLAELDTDALVALDKAAFFYQQLVRTFPAHEKRDEYRFYRAEALFAARRYKEAVPDYEHLAYSADTELAEQYSADAGYAAIVAYNRHLEEIASEDDKARWLDAAVDAMLRFTRGYHQDQRSSSVLGNAAEHLFGLGAYERALEFTRTLLAGNSALGDELRETAYGISAHALFKLERYAEASEYYLRQRNLLDESEEKYQAVSERLATAIYKNGEALIAQGEKESAVDELLRLKTLSPNSPVRITAQHDAATLLLEAENWKRAVAELEQLARDFPGHALAVEFPRKLAFAYENSRNWRKAAERYQQVAESDPDPDLRRESLYLAASMYEKDGDYPAAITQYKAYAHGYPKPFATNMEARYRLVQNYERIGDLQKRLFWLDKLVEGNRRAKDQRNERSQWLAAWANVEYGDYHAREFDHHNLYPPLDRSVPAKNKHLELAAERYELAADSGIFEFVTMGTYKIADLYQDFARALRESPRPQGLSAEEKQLYDQIIAEQAQPFDEVAAEMLHSNIQRAWDGEFNDWINRSYADMRRLHPERFAKTELVVSYGDEIH